MTRKNFAHLLIFCTLLCGCVNPSNTPKQGNEHVIDTITTDTTLAETICEKRDSLFGIEIENLSVLNAQIPKNKTLSEILTPYNISRQTIHEMEVKSKPIFNVRKIRNGNNYYIFQENNDSIPRTKHFVYEISSSEYIVYTFGDTLSIRREEKELTRHIRQVEGEITTSLWNAVTGQNIPFALAIELSNIYAWNIDFFGLQKGDKFRAHYSEIWCDSAFIRIDTIYCAIFTHCGTDFHAIPFTQDDRRDYYDYEGNSLRKAFLKAPLSYSRISSSFSHNRFHPVLKINRPHHGVDYAAPAGTPVSTIGDGRVIFKGYAKGGGNTVKVQHNSTHTTVYMHLSKFGKISVGSYVHQGDIIGYVGSTGISTGPHLDFRVYQNGQPIDPLKLKSPPVEPVKPALMDSFKTVRDQLLKSLEKNN